MLCGYVDGLLFLCPKNQVSPKISVLLRIFLRNQFVPFIFTFCRYVISNKILKIKVKFSALKQVHVYCIYKCMRQKLFNFANSGLSEIAMT